MAQDKDIILPQLAVGHLHYQAQCLKDFMLQLMENNRAIVVISFMDSY